MYRINLVLLVLLLLAQLACQRSSGEVVVPPAAPAPTAAAPGAMKTTPTGLQYQDLVPGTGRRPMLGQTVTVKYVGKLADGQTFETGKFDFRLGDPTVIKGFNLGIAGGEGIDAMKVDGKRLLILPPELAYGKEGNAPKVPPNATISFEIELLKIQGGMGF